MRDEERHTIKMFLKFGNEKNINDLYENGTIYLNTIQYFRSFEDAELRGDSYEGVTRVKNAFDGDFEIPELKYKGKFISLHTKQSYEKILGNIYSLYCISSFTIPDPLKFSIDEKNMGFGSHCLMVKNNDIFLKKIESNLKSLNYKFCHGFVKYYDRYKINDYISLFQKPNEFSYQNEFRIYVKSNTIAPIVLKIGNLREIAEIVTVNDIMTLSLTLQ